MREQSIVGGVIKPSAIHFNTGNGEKLRLDDKGFHYNDQLIEDAGLAYSKFMAWLDSEEAKRGDTK